MTTPPYIRIPFASSGDVAPVPLTVQPDGSVSYPQGYGPDYALDPALNPSALDIERAIMNQLFNDITTALQYLQQHGVSEFITSADNGGSPYSYSQGDKCRLDSSGVVYQSLVNSNTDTPPSVKWRAVEVTAPLLVANALSELTASAATARSNISAAKSGANVDITSLGTVTDLITASAGQILNLHSDQYIGMVNRAGSAFVEARGLPASTANGLTTLSQFAGLIGTTGRFVIPTGAGGAPLIVQFGKAFTTGGGSVAVTFGTTFPTAVLNVTTGLLSTSPINAYHAFGNVTTSGMNLFTNAAGAGLQLGEVNYMAVGY